MTEHEGGAGRSGVRGGDLPFEPLTYFSREIDRLREDVRASEKRHAEQLTEALKATASANETVQAAVAAVGQVAEENTKMATAMTTENAKLATAMTGAVGAIQSALQHTKEKSDADADAKSKFAVMQAEVDLLKRLVYGGVGLVLIGVITAVLALVINKG